MKIRPSASLFNRCLTIAGLAIPLLVTLVLAYLAHRVDQIHDNGSRWLLHTLEVKAQLERVDSTVKDVESSYRGYLLNQDDGFLSLYDQSLKKLSNEEADLTELVADNSRQVAANSKLQDLIAKKVAIASQIMTLAEQGNLADAIQVVKDGTGKLAMDEIVLQIDSMTAEEDRLLALRRDEFASEINTENFLMATLVVGNLLLIAGITFHLLRLRKSRLTAEVQTDQANDRTDEANRRTKDAAIVNEEAVLASELRYRRLFETAPDGILILDAETGQVVDANPFMKDLLGYSQEEFLGKKLWEIGPFRGAAASKIAFAELQLNDRLHYEGLPLETRHGNRVEVEFISSAYLVGEKRLIQCNIRDTTERRRAQAQTDQANTRTDQANTRTDQANTRTEEAEARSVATLRRSELRYRRLFETAPDGILILDAETGQVVDANPFMKDLLGYSQEEFLGRKLWEIGPFKGAAASKIAFAELQLNDRLRYEGLPLETKEGNRVEVEFVSSAYLVGEKRLIQCNIRDITERKRSEEQIAEQAAFLDKAQDAIIVCDLSGGVVFWNKGAERMYGWTRQEAVGQNKCELLHSDINKFDEARDVTLRKGEWHGELHHFTKDNRERMIEARWTLIRDQDDNPKSILGINTDVTESRKIEAQFMRAQRMESIGTLAGGVAHDLNNILAPILMSIGILKSISKDPQAEKILETIEISAKRGADIVRQVLSFARGLDGERIEVQPKHLLKDLEHIIKETFPKDIQLQFSIPNNCSTILGDPTQLHQILLNLSVNARDAMPGGGKLSITVENCEMDELYVAAHLHTKVGRYVNISVTDTGTGIPPAILDKIFEPFFTTKALNKGTGLGLSSVMAIVKSHDGVINVYSEPGKGTTFKVYLPAAEMSLEASKEQADEVSMPRGDNETILVVDDEASILSITSQTLQAFGYRVLTATDGADALAVYSQRRDEIAVVLTDMMMPVMDGTAVIHVLKRINPSIKIVAASGLNSNAGLAKASVIGVTHFLEKPYTAGALLKTMRAILAEK